MLLLIFLVLTIPLASQLLSTISIHGFAFLIFSLNGLLCDLSPLIEILGGSNQLTQIFQINDILLSFITSFQESLLTIPIIVYSNTETGKSAILTETKGKAGIYQWTQNKSGKIYRVCR